MTRDGVSLLTVVMHELGHLLGYEHSADGLMAPVLSASSSRIPDPASQISDLGSQISDLGSFLPHPSSFLLSAASRADDVFAALGRDGSEESGSVLLESRGGEGLAAAASRSSDEAVQARVPRRGRLQRYERDLDACFAQLSADEGAMTTE